VAPHQLLTAIFPDDCRICGNPLSEFHSVPVCSRCLDAARPHAGECCCERCGAPQLHRASLDEEGVCRLCRSGKRGFDSCYSYGGYSGELRHLIHVFKYERVESLAHPLARRMLSAMPRHIAFDVIAPVPMHWWKRFRRGFNQAGLLAREISRNTAIPVADVLRRSKLNQIQAGLAVSARRRNAAASFELRDGEGVRNKRVLLVDDVFTTGATATACARLLKKAGAQFVAVLTIARVDRRAPAPLSPSVPIFGLEPQCHDKE
jgi:ComF family protein